MSDGNAGLEIEAGARFAFGANWARFLAVLDEDRIRAAEAAIKNMIAVETLSNLRFLDIGSGSGLSSLAARRLGATVHSFDFDPESVACTLELKRRYFPADESWCIEQGSVLDRRYLDSLGHFDIVYSWGVLHHTGSMWLALENAIARVANADGRLFIALYNDQGWKSHAWWFVKLLYNRLPKFLRATFTVIVSALVSLVIIIKYTMKLRPTLAVASVFHDRRERGMSAKVDRIDWIGGFPFEFVAYDTVLEYLQARGFTVVKTRRDTSAGCNEFVVRR